MSELGEWITRNFNNRELASAVWLTIILLLFSLKKGGRESLKGIVAVACQSTLLVLLLCFALNVTILSWLGTYSTVWGLSLLTQTIIWYFLGGLPLLARAFEAKEGTQHFRGYAKDALSGAALLEFIFVAETFGLLTELFLVPAVTALAMMVVISERSPEYSAVNKLLTWILAFVAIVIFWNSLSQIWAAPEGFFTTQMFRNFILPIYLTIGSIPFFYAVHCYSHIEGARIQIDMKTFQSDELKKYAKKRLFWAFALRPWLLRRATRQFHSMPAKNNDDVVRIIRDVLEYHREEKNPPQVDERVGWSPHSAREFLTDEGLRTGDFHAGYDEEEWWSGVASRDLDEGLVPGIVNYSFAGVKGVAKSLKLKGHFVAEFVSDEALAEFSRLAVVLLERAAPHCDVQVSEKLTKREEFDVEQEGVNVHFSEEVFPNGKGGLPHRGDPPDLLARRFQSSSVHAATSL